MTPQTRRILVAGGLAAVLLIAVMTARDEVADGGLAPPKRAAAPATAGEIPVADVKLELLEETRPELGDAERNLFRFQPRAAANAPARPRPVPVPRDSAAPSVAARSGPPQPPTIPLRFIGLVDAPLQARRVAILSDGRGNVFYGREGDIIEGRYRIGKVSPDVVELSYLDGRGRQTIRLSGQ